MESEEKIVCFDKLHSLYALYNDVRRAVILAENFNEGRKMPIAPINQLRSALDHIFKAISNAKDPNQCDYELKEAKEHLDRAGYDALELLAGNLGAKILNRLNVYSSETITKVFPDYYSEIDPKITKIKQEVAILRSEKKISSDQSFSNYFFQIAELIDIDKKVATFIPALDKFENKRKKENRRHWEITAFITVLGVIVGWLLNKYL